MLKTAYSNIPSNTYKTPQSALAKFMAACEKCGVTDMSYVIAVDPTTGRFFPLGLPSADQCQDAIFLAHNGVSVFRN